MTTTVRLGKQRIALDDSMLLGAGGEGNVYAWNGLALKVFHAPSPARADKIRAFPRGLPEAVLGPLDVLEDSKRNVVGYAMKLAPKAVELVKLGQRKWREGNLSCDDVSAVFGALRSTVDDLHARGVIVGDFNDGNVLVSDRRPLFIDADSMQYGRFPCVVGHERFLDPALFGVDLAASPAFSRDTDWYAFAVLLFSSWLYVHPYGGSHPAHRTLLRRAEARCSILSADVKLPPSAAHFRVLSDDMLDYFARVFDRGDRGPVPPSLLATRWSRCGCGAEHARAHCPECARPRGNVPVAIAGGLRVQTVVRPRGRVIAACVRGGRLAYVIEEDGRWLREDATPVAVVPGARVCISGPNTWLAKGERAACMRGGRVVEELSCGAFRGEPAFDANATDAFYLAQEWLVRASTGERIGRVLEGGTFLRVGERFGFGMYRAGMAPFPFVFDVRGAGLKHLSLDVPRGKLVDLDVTFDRDQALVTMTADDAGKRTIAAFWIREDGALLAHARGDADAMSLFDGAPACMAHGAILVATERGLVLARPDARTGEIVEHKVFPETRDALAGATSLLPGPGGSVYVASNQEILSLSLA